MAMLYMKIPTSDLKSFANEATRNIKMAMLYMKIPTTDLKSEVRFFSRQEKEHLSFSYFENHNHFISIIARA
jgi:hypothetical protein